jgi:hypothetical protein
MQSGRAYSDACSLRRPMNMIECEDWKGREGIKLYSKE